MNEVEKKEEIVEDKKIPNNDQQKSNTEKPKSLEQIYDETKDREFLVKTIISLEKQMTEIVSKLDGKNSSDFTASEVKATNQTERDDGGIEVDDKYFKKGVK